MTQYCKNCGVVAGDSTTSRAGDGFRQFCRQCRNAIKKASGKEASSRTMKELTTLETYTPIVNSLIPTPKPLPVTTRTAYLDIETSGISKSEYTKVLSYVILDAQTGEVYPRTITKEEIDADNDLEDHIIRGDTELLRQLVRDLSRYNRIVTWFGRGFDIPTLRTRCSLVGVQFPAPWDLVHEDLYFTAKKKYRFTSNRLGAVAEKYGCPLKKTEVTPKAWDLAARGDERALEYVREHNILDVQILAYLDAKFKGQHKEIRSAL